MHHDFSILFEQECQIQVMGRVSGHSNWDMPKRYTYIKPEGFPDESHQFFFEAMQTAYDSEEIIKLMCVLCAAYGRKEIDRNTMGPLVMLAFNRNDLFQQSLRRQNGARTQKKIAAEQHPLWQEEANEVSRENPRLKKNAVAEQVRINLGYKGPADTIAGVIKIPKK